MHSIEDSFVHAWYCSLCTKFLRASRTYIQCIALFQNGVDRSYKEISKKKIPTANWVVKKFSSFLKICLDIGLLYLKNNKSITPFFCFRILLIAFIKNNFFPLKFDACINVISSQLPYTYEMHFLLHNLGIAFVVLKIFMQNVYVY